MSLASDRAQIAAVNATAKVHCEDFIFVFQTRRVSLPPVRAARRRWRGSFLVVWCELEGKDSWKSSSSRVHRCSSPWRFFLFLYVYTILLVFSRIKTGARGNFPRTAFPRTALPRAALLRALVIPLSLHYA